MQMKGKKKKENFFFSMTIKKFTLITLLYFLLSCSPQR